MNSHNIQKIYLKENKADARLDLFKLHDDVKDDVPEKWIVASGLSLKQKIAKLVNAICQSGMSESSLVKHLMKRFNISITSAERLVYLKKEWYPLVFMRELLLILNKEDEKFGIQDDIQYLKVSQPPLKVLKAPTYLTFNLCKIAGAHAADGTTRENYFSIVDGYKSNLVAFQIWIFSEFGLKTNLIEVSEREWKINFNNKIFTRYLTKLFGFPSGCKQYTVTEPDLIKTAGLDFRKAFALGALTFEAGIGMKHEVEFCVVSKNFRDCISEILFIHKIKHTLMIKQSSRYWRFWSNSLSKEEAISWMDFFEEKTEKWLKLRDLAYGFTKPVNSFLEAKYILSKYNPKQSASKVILVDVLDAIEQKRAVCRYEIVSDLKTMRNLHSYGGIWAHSIKHYLDILHKANVIKIERRKFGKKKSFGSIVREVYCFNENISEWRLPDRTE